MSPKPRKVKAMLEEATAIHSRIVRLRDGRCLKCGSTYQLQCSHIIPRRFSATRTDEANGQALCGSCHNRIENHYDERMDWFRESIGMDEFYRLKQKAIGGLSVQARTFWTAELARLRAVLADMEQGREGAA